MAPLQHIPAPGQGVQRPAAAGGGRRSRPPASAPSTTRGANTTNWLFVVDAGGGSAADGTVTRRDVGQYVASFTDRPERIVRRIPVADLVARWDRLGFVADPPNASRCSSTRPVRRTTTTGR
jgi:hypothetical protein